MKLRLSSAILLLAITTSQAYASHTMDISSTASTPSKLYFGIFGGGGSSNSFNLTQSATAFFTEAQGGPLAVNAFGTASSQSTGYFGVQIGYQMADMSFVSSGNLSMAPAFELEGYGMGQTTFKSTVINNTARLEAHDFDVTLPMTRTVYVGNIVLNFSTPRLPVHPYVGFGIGGALMNVSGADSLQTDPMEAGLNHVNANTSASTSAFAGQIKVGASYDVTKCITVFADYRWVYIASSQFTLGSTVAPGHAETSPWIMNLAPQNYNLGNVGIRINFA